MQDPHCIFCKILSGAIPCTPILETANTLAFLDINPIEKGHILVIPKRHWSSLLTIPTHAPEDAACFQELMAVVQLLAKATQDIGASGVNILQCNGESAGQTVSHLHFHVIPRYPSSKTPPQWTSGLGQYASPEEREQFASQLAQVAKQRLSQEGLLSHE